MNISESQIDNLVNLLDGYAEKGGHHLNVNVFTQRETPGCTGTSGKISAAYRQSIRLCSKL